MDVAAPGIAATTGRAPRPADPCAFVVFGAGGDLTKRLLLPALYNLAAGKLLPEGFALVGVARAPWSGDEFRDRMRSALEEFATDGVAAKTLDALLRHCYYVRGDFDDPAIYDALKRQLADLGRSAGTRGNGLFYLATPQRVAHSRRSSLRRAGFERNEYPEQIPSRVATPEVAQPPRRFLHGARNIRVRLLLSSGRACPAKASPVPP